MIREQSSFTDAAGKVWRLRITIDTVRRVKASTGIDLVASFESVVRTLSDDLVRFADALYVIVCTNSATTSEEFGRALAGDVIGDAFDATVEALRDFMPGLRNRARVGKVIEAARKATENLNDQLDRGLTEALSSGQPSGISPASSESTQDP